MTAPRTLEPRTHRRLTRHPAGRPDPERLATAIVHAYLEVEAGRRPLEQIRPVLSPSVYDQRRAVLRRRRDEALAARGRHAPSGPSVRAVRAVRIDRPADGVLEATVAAEVGGRTSAVCVRLEAWRSSWRATELARPEDGTRPIASRLALPAGPPAGRESSGRSG